MINPNAITESSRSQSKGAYGTQLRRSERTRVRDLTRSAVYQILMASINNQSVISEAGFRKSTIASLKNHGLIGGKSDGVNEERPWSQLRTMAVVKNIASVTSHCLDDAPWPQSRTMDSSEKHALNE